MERPLKPYEDLFREKGIAWKLADNVLTVNGGRGYGTLALDPGTYRLPGNVSSQFFTGLLFVMPLLEGDSTLVSTTPLESRDYLEMTRQAQAAAGVTSRWLDENTLFVPGGQTYQPFEATVEADWSQAGFWYAAISWTAGGHPGPEPRLCPGGQGSQRTLLAAGPARGHGDRCLRMPRPAAAPGGDGGGPLRHHPVCERRPAADEGERPALHHRRPADRPGRPGGGGAGLSDSPRRDASPAARWTAPTTTGSPWRPPSPPPPAPAPSRCWGPNACRSPTRISGRSTRTWEVISMSSEFGSLLKISVFGQSHGRAIGVVVDGLPAGEAIDLEELNAFLARRKPGKSHLSTARKEADTPVFLSGLENGVTCGAPLCAVIENRDQHSSDYDALQDKPRPGHADYTAFVKWGGQADMRGGGHFSGRLTAPLCIAGGIAKQILARRGVYVGAHLQSVGTDGGRHPSPCGPRRSCLTPWPPSHFPVLDEQAGERMQALILEARQNRDSVGGVVECAAIGPARRTGRAHVRRRGKPAGRRPLRHSRREGRGVRRRLRRRPVPGLGKQRPLCDGGRPGGRRRPTTPAAFWAASPAGCPSSCGRP